MLATVKIGWKIDMTSSNYIKKISKEYALYVCTSRGIPNIGDGLKSVQRKMLWTIKNKADKIKTISLVGAAIEDNIYVHGDAAGATAVSQMAAPFKNNVCLIEGHGNFGSRVNPEGWAAPRYTYVKKSKLTEKLIYSDIDIIPMMENYDGSTMEPETFLPLIPLILLNGVSGIAVGWATEILPRSFSDIVQTCIDELKGKKLKRILPSYDYLNCTVTQLEDNTYEICGKIKIVDSSTVSVIELSPYISLEKFKENLDTLEEKGIINSYQDKSTKTINVVIKFPRGSLKDKSEYEIIKELKLNQRKTENIVALDFDGDSPSYYNNELEVIKQFIEWRLLWYTLRYEKIIENDEYELKYYKGLKTCIQKKLPDKINKLQSKQLLKDTVNNMTANVLDDSQVERLIAIPFYRWTNDFINYVDDKIAKLQENIDKNNEILSDDDNTRKIYISELEDLKKLKIK